MITKFFIASCLAVLCMTSNAQPENCFRGFWDIQTQKIGYINQNGEIIILPQYDSGSALISVNGLAAVEKEGKFGCINRNNELVIPIDYDDMSDYQYDRIVVGRLINDQMKYGVINGRNELIVAFEYDFITEFHEGIAGIKKENHYGFINKNGKILVEPIYFRVGDFSEGLAAVFVDRSILNVAVNEDEISFRLNNIVEGTNNGKATINYINNCGKDKISTTFLDAGPFCEGKAVVTNGNSFGFIDKTGAIVIDMNYEWCHSFSEGLAPGQVDGKFGFIDHSGKWVIAPQFDRARPFHMERAAVMVQGEQEEFCWGFIDKTGAFVIEPVYNDVSDYNEGLAWIQMKDLHEGYIDLQGNIIFKFAVNP